MLHPMRLLVVLLLVVGSEAARPPLRSGGRGTPRRAATSRSRQAGARSAKKPKPNGKPLFPALFGPPPSRAPPASPRLSLEDAVTTVRGTIEQVKPLQVLSGFVLAILVASSAVVTTGNAVSSFLAEDGNGEVLERALKFGTILENVKAAYVDRDVDLESIFQTGVNAMLSVLDPYSTYENADQAEDLQMRTTGRYGGVGLTIGKDDKGEVLVLGALEGFAFDAGVRPGDRIKAVDGKPVKDKTVDAVKTMLRGEPGTSISITVQRDGSPEPTLSMDLRRQLVRLPDVTLATIDNQGVGYIKLEGFSEGTAEEMARAVRKLQSLRDERGMNALVLDMRDNPGGLLDAAVAVSQQLVPEGTEIVSTAGRVYGEGTSLSYRSTRPPLLNPRTRLVVLVNANTASAAEIVTGVVQDTDRGVVVGERTFGKGLVQIVEPLPGGGSLKLTVAKYYTPSGRCIQAVNYGGGRVEANAKKAMGGAAAGAAKEDGAAIDPAVPALPSTGASPEGGGDGGGTTTGSGSGSGDKTTGATPAGGAKSGGAGGARKPAGGPSSTGTSKTKPDSSDVAGAISRGFDPADPSRPRASPDTDKVVYVTSHGRAVKAGGGIAPDVVVSGRLLGELERSLLQRGLFFEFSGEFLQKHAAPLDVLPARVDAMQEDAYRDFVSFVRQKVAETDTLLEPTGLQRQLDGLQKSISSSAGPSGGGRERSLRDLAALRRQLRDEQLDELRTQKALLKQDVLEALLGRLTAPSQRLAAQLVDDPQVVEALALARDESKYAKVLEPDPALADGGSRTSDGLKVVRRPALPPLPPEAMLFPKDDVLAIGDFAFTPTSATPAEGGRNAARPAAPPSA